MPSSTNTPPPALLLILDGFGYSETSDFNAIAKAHTPFLDDCLAKYPHRLIEASGTAVGLPDGQMGNSEVGHMHIGAGRVVRQNFSLINNEISNGEFFKNSVLLEAVKTAKKNNKAIHVLGLLSDGGVHSHYAHLFALLQLFAAETFTNGVIHAFLDGRDTPPKSALAAISALEAQLEKTPVASIASVSGRYYAMDRDNRWDRIEQAYDVLTTKTTSSLTAKDIISQAYAADEVDEFIKPTACLDHRAIDDGDCVIFFNFRADRARELTHALTDKTFSHFRRSQQPSLDQFISFTQYDSSLLHPVAFPPQTLKNTLGECVEQAGLAQFRIAETEKYAHVTFFLNGGREAPFVGETRQLIPSPSVATYDLMPEMSAKEVTSALCQAIQEGKASLYVCNFANADMVGHTGNMAATIRAIECLDTCLKDIAHAMLDMGGDILITADHGNAECLYNAATEQAHTAHTTEPVPFIHIGRPSMMRQGDGSLKDIAPTLLHLLGIKPPAEMDGLSLLEQ